MIDPVFLLLATILTPFIGLIGIIALSWLGPHGFSQASVEAGADAFVDKMTMASDLLPAMQRVAQQTSPPAH